MGKNKNEAFKVWYVAEGHKGGHKVESLLSGWNAAMKAAAKECDHHTYQQTVVGRDITGHLKRIILKMIK